MTDNVELVCSVCGAPAPFDWEQIETCPANACAYGQNRPKPKQPEPRVPNAARTAGGRPVEALACPLADCDGILQAGVCQTCRQRPAVVVRIENTGNSIRLEQGAEIELGRDKGPLASVLTLYDNVSSRHCLLRLSGSAIEIKDVGTGGEGSLNGTYVDDCEIEPGTWVEVEPGDVVRLGRDNKDRNLRAVLVRFDDDA